jgi:hypothetical protein
MVIHDSRLRARLELSVQSGRVRVHGAGQHGGGACMRQVSGGAEVHGRACEAGVHAWEVSMADPWCEVLSVLHFMAIFGYKVLSVLQFMVIFSG